MEIWPAIDIRGGRCVRLRQGDYARETVYGADPVEMAIRWKTAGTKHLHLVDLDGAKEGCAVNQAIICRIVQTLGPTVLCELGGGIRDETTIDGYLEQGIGRLVIGTLALKNPRWFREMALRYPGKLVLGIDARSGMVATEGWLETSTTPAVELAASFADLPLAAIVYTDIATDGMMQGPNIAEIRKFAAAIPVPVVASGGVATLDDVRRLKASGIPACIIGRALYEGTIDLSEALREAASDTLNEFSPG